MTNDDNENLGNLEGNEGNDLTDDVPPILHLEIMNINLMRLYDVQSAILNHLDPDLWAMIDAKHSRGRFFQGPPYMAGDNPWGDEDE